jgi:hypothetical protein
MGFIPYGSRVRQVFFIEVNAKKSVGRVVLREAQVHPALSRPGRITGKGKCKGKDECRISNSRTAEPQKGKAKAE